MLRLQYCDAQDLSETELQTHFLLKALTGADILPHSLLKICDLHRKRPQPFSLGQAAYGLFPHHLYVRTIL